MLSDLEIAQAATLEELETVAERIGIGKEYLIPFGHYKAKVRPEAIEAFSSRKPGKLILVTTTNPTSAGEGKTTMVIGLAQALAKLGKRVSLGIREPSLGPTMGIKGGAAGGGYSQVLPMEDINLHFTGDLHAVASAHNLLAAMVDNHLHFADKTCEDPREIVWKRVLDMNDRSLRHTVIGLGGKKDGMPRENGFDITAASEVMAVLCLARDFPDLKERLGRIVVAYGKSTGVVTAKDIGAVGAMALLLKDAFMPNLVQTIEGVPAFVHGGPFANIAHGTSSLVSTKLGLASSDYFVTEAGFGSDLGAEKFFNIACRYGGLKPSAVVIVVTIRSLKKQGGVPNKELSKEYLPALKTGLGNLKKHMDIIHSFGLPLVVAVNRFNTDTEAELDLVLGTVKAAGVPVALSEHHAKGGEGALEVARLLDNVAGEGLTPKYTYCLDESLDEKITAIATRIYGATSVSFSHRARKRMKLFEKMGYSDLAVCMAKTQYSLSDDPKLLGVPKRFKIKVSDIRLSAGAGFVVPTTGEITTMPGLPRKPAAMNMDVDENGKVSGLF